MAGRRPRCRCRASRWGEYVWMRIEPMCGARVWECAPRLHSNHVRTRQNEKHKVCLCALVCMWILFSSTTPTFTAHHHMRALSGLFTRSTPHRNEAALSVGYTPFLEFDVQDMNSTVPNLIQLGGKVGSQPMHCMPRCAVPCRWNALYGVRYGRSHVP